MPKQVRITSGYILTGEKIPLPGKYLTLDKVVLKKEILDNIFVEDTSLNIENVKKIERNESKNIHILYVEPSKRGEIIGKNGSNIKKLRKSLGTIIVRDYDNISN